VPNSTIAKSKIVNVSSPTGIHGVTIAVQLDPQTAPATGTEILAHAILNCRLIVATPAPIITVTAINATYTEYEITFFVDELGAVTRAQNQVFDLMFRHLTVAGMALAPAPHQPPWAGEDSAVPRVTTGPERVLELVAMFASLTRDERKALAAKLTPASYDQGETLVEPGAVLHALCIVGAGVLSFTREASGGERELLRLGPGDHFGELGMLTGAPATAKIRALLPTTIYALAKEDLAPILEARPAVAHELSQALAQRQRAGHLADSTELAETMPAHRLSRWFSERLHRLYDLANAE
jgi:CRP-like cAMP-binding protein